MSESITAATAAAQAPTAWTTPADVAAHTPGVVSAARWFWWIALLTFINAAGAAARAQVDFVLGLATSQLGHAVFRVNVGVAYAIDAVLVASFLLIGHLARRGRAWAFVLGTGLYLCDALVCAKFGHALPIVFHVVVLVFLVRGASALNAGLRRSGLD